MKDEAIMRKRPNILITMLNYPLIKARYDQLDITDRKALLRKLFGDNKQSITYFKRIANPGLDKLEILADYLELPIDMLRVNCKYDFSPKGSNKATRVESKVPTVNINIQLDKSVIIEALNQKLDKYLTQCFAQPKQEMDGEYRTSSINNYLNE